MYENQTAAIAFLLERDYGISIEGPIGWGHFTQGAYLGFKGEVNPKPFIADALKRWQVHDAITVRDLLDAGLSLRTQRSDTWPEVDEERADEALQRLPDAYDQDDAYARAEKVLGDLVCWANEGLEEGARRAHDLLEDLYMAAGSDEEILHAIRTKRFRLVVKRHGTDDEDDLDWSLSDDPEDALDTLERIRKEQWKLYVITATLHAFEEGDDPEFDEGEEIASETRSMGLWDKDETHFGGAVRELVSDLISEARVTHGLEKPARPQHQPLPLAA